MTNRDWAAEIAAIIDTETQTGDYHPRELAGRIIKMLRDEDPELLLGWLEGFAEEHLYHLIRSKARSTRAKIFSHARRELFRAAAEQAEATGNYEALQEFLDAPWHVPGQGYKSMRAMKYADLDPAIGFYQRQAATNIAREAFLRRVKLLTPEGMDPIDAMSDEQWEELRQRMFS